MSTTQADLKSSNGFRSDLRQLISHRYFQRFIIALILFNAVTLGMETSPSLMEKHGLLLHHIDKSVLTLFILELVIRIIAMGRSFFKDPWSLFDLFVVGIALIPHSGELAILRTLRVLRVLRLISVVPSMRQVVTGLISSLGGIAAVSMILSIVYYIFAVIATKLFADYSQELFGTLGNSMFTLFQIMTLEGWADIARPIMQMHPYAWLFFVTYILISTFTMLNLFIGVMVNAMANSNWSGQERRSSGFIGIDRAKEVFAKVVTESNAPLLEEIHKLKNEIADLQMNIKLRR
jgi:voltage-gated sodium channel